MVSRVPPPLRLLPTTVNKMVKCTDLFARGTALLAEDRLDESLQCFLGCLKCVQAGEDFSQLAECLHHVREPAWVHPIAACGS